jgi:hypothetical protein
MSGHQTIKMCLDADTDSKMAIWGQAMKSDQPVYEEHRHPHRRRLGVPERMRHGPGRPHHLPGHGRRRLQLEVHGQGLVDDHGAAFAQANGNHEMTLTAEYQGACPAGMKGGDVTIDVPGMKGGMTMNLEQMQAMSAGGRPPPVK